MKLDLKTELVLGALAMLIALPAFGEPNPDKDAFYGETHVHTSWSFDAFIFGNYAHHKPAVSSSRDTERVRTGTSTPAYSSRRRILAN